MCEMFVPKGHLFPDVLGTFPKPGMRVLTASSSLAPTQDSLTGHPWTTLNTQSSCGSRAGDTRLSPKAQVLTLVLGDHSQICPQLEHRHQGYPRAVLPGAFGHAAMSGFLGLAALGIAQLCPEVEGTTSVWNLFPCLSHGFG
jgi:hypothetical protein